MQRQSSNDRGIKALPIGVFDSGIGGLTVAREIARQLPHESLLYFGDTLRCPYGPRPLAQIRGFAHQIAHWLDVQGVKLIVIACNSATAAGLESIQQELDVPVIGVVEPGARAAAQSTLLRRVGVIGTEATIESGIYEREIHRFDAGIITFSKATPRFVDMVEQGLLLDNGFLDDSEVMAPSIDVPFSQMDIAYDYLNPLRMNGVDTLVLGCTHYPLLRPLISQVMGADIRIISSAEETARDVAEILGRKDQLAGEGDVVTHRLVTTAHDTQRFLVLANRILSQPVTNLTRVTLGDLEGSSSTLG